MLSLITHAALALLEKELINYEPELQDLIIEELKKAGEALNKYLKSKTKGENNA